ncbi:twin-arginine translocation pathway signal [Candidatus Protofrankia californiensis]|uniref:Twin-arginine translocation pathway signal n=1 Tax=Candidatus Protofrankia californiensis TaxID=1839754 RepID=A0A1C3NVX9_9ACTN|nr:twin-arginine translocation pathway signal [Candidatus Protofrankia californiensis]
MADSDAVRQARRALGLHLAALRRQAGHSQHSLAPLVQYSRSTLANVETGYQHAPKDFWQRADAVLDAHGVLLAGFEQIEAAIRDQRALNAQQAEADRLAHVRQQREASGVQARTLLERLAGEPNDRGGEPAVGSPSPSPSNLVDGATVGHSLELPNDQPRIIASFGEVVIVALDRRSFLTSSSLGLLAGNAVTPLASPAQIAPEIVTYLDAQLDGYYQAEALLGPLPVIPGVLVQHELIRQLLASAGSLRTALLRTAAAYTGLITWLYQDAGDMQAATHWADETLELAHRVEDTQLIRHALTNKAMIYTDRRDGISTLDLTRAALADERTLCAKVRVQATQQAAHGRSLIGDRKATDELLDRAAGYLAHVDDNYPWFNACRRTPSYIEAQRATCYNRLGLGAEAAHLWEQVIADLPATARRDTGVYRARQAVAFATGRQPEAAVNAVEQAVTIAEETSSVRLRQELRHAWDSLTPWREDAAVRDVRDQLVRARALPADVRET